jgi:hypothetical protein
MKTIGHFTFILIYCGGAFLAWMLPADYAWFTLIFALVWFPVSRWISKWILYCVDKIYMSRHPSVPPSRSD